MKHSCINCLSSFEISDKELSFYGRISPKYGGNLFAITPPSVCPRCRLQTRLAFRNERSLYKRSCDLSGQSIVSVYSREQPFPVYANEIWWSESYDPSRYSREFDFSRPFFEQFAELEACVPRLAIYHSNSENSLYTNYSIHNKNSYLLVGCTECEDSLYSYRSTDCKDIMDCYDLLRSQICYECIECTDLSFSHFCQNCHNSHDLILCENCFGCQYCFGAVNLRNKCYFIFDQQVNPDVYQERVEALLANLDRAREEFQQARLRSSFKATYTLNCEECHGDRLINCRACLDCFNLKTGWDCRYCSFGENNKDCQDINHFDNCELQYDSCCLEKNYNVIFSNFAWFVRSGCYLSFCFNSENIFACSGMKNAKCCVFNKSYNIHEYETLVSKIILHMQETGEWGGFFPIRNSAFGYNETVAQEDFPLTKKQALEKGYRWKDSPAQGAELGDDESTVALAENISCCNLCKRKFKLTAQEIKFYSQQSLATPYKCPDCRHLLRKTKTSPGVLWPRRCAECKDEIISCFAPERKEIVVCDKCYLGTLD